MNRDMRKQMKNILFLIIITIIGSSNAFAFGGGGHGRVSNAYKSGVDAFGIHVNPDKPIDPPIFIDCDEQTETEIKGVCCANEKVYANGTKCCDKDGYEVKEDACQKVCATGLMPVGDECVDLCENYTSTKCKPTCDWKTGEGKAGNEGDLCNNNQGRCNDGECEPIVCDICTELNTTTGNCDAKVCGTNAHCDSDSTSETKNTCICDEGYKSDGQGGCKESCPTDRQCGETCCGEGNVCIDNTYCCHKDYENWGSIEDSGACCPASESTGFGSYNWGCCSLEQTTYTTDDYGTTQCCSGSLYKNAGYNNATLCCANEPEQYEDKDFKVCWAPETNCKNNADCAEGEFCNLKNETDYSCYYPTSGTCEQITTSDYTDAEVDGLGDVRRSKNYMTWWAAENWCKAQGKSLIDISKFGCYRSNTSTLVEEGSEYHGGCCASGQTCSDNRIWFTDANKAKYSSTLKALESAFGHSVHFWTASNNSSTDSCTAFAVSLQSGLVYDYGRHNGYTSALCE